ncbi:hypothetical protein OG339_42255 [Streptosporangium sp. NBC_01495]|uniref:hypothetical protein n=1 Tax=Streptosporangium sp. NBC_01495 TaxID=2903899 RepID=UPI002E31451A|nr:hypothetical protein [Streptosporangium sp. NBC_01495]
MAAVFATTDCVVSWSQGQSPLCKGDVWDDQAQLVLERPDLFAAEPTLIRGRQVVLSVETATAAPDAKRATVKRK